jgi:hypothetical protein
MSDIYAFVAAGDFVGVAVTVIDGVPEDIGLDSAKMPMLVDVPPV